VAKLAIVGDVHLIWDDRDVSSIDALGYDLVLFVGDLAGYSPKGGLAVARSIAKLRTPALVMPGNHDGVTLPQLASEVFGAPHRIRDALSFRMQGRVDDLALALGPIALAGYGTHRFEAAGFTIVAARPHSLGGPELAFRRFLEKRYGIKTMRDSADRLCSLFDQVAPGERIVVLAHCGPKGLGDTRSDIFGCDFRPEQGDFGDPDLATALAHARTTQKSVLAVVAGHMHHRLRGGGYRRWQLAQDGVTFVNAARVPRRRSRDSGEERHHVSLTLSGTEVSVDEVWTKLV